MFLLQQYGASSRNSSELSMCTLSKAKLLHIKVIPAHQPIEFIPLHVFQSPKDHLLEIIGRLWKH